MKRERKRRRRRRGKVWKLFLNRLLYGFVCIAMDLYGLLDFCMDISLFNF